MALRNEMPTSLFVSYENKKPRRNDLRRASRLRHSADQNFCEIGAYLTDTGRPHCRNRIVGKFESSALSRAFYIVAASRLSALGQKRTCEHLVAEDSHERTGI